MTSCRSVRPARARKFVTWTGDPAGRVSSCTDPVPRPWRPQTHRERTLARWKYPPAAGRTPQGQSAAGTHPSAPATRHHTRPWPSCCLPRVRAGLLLDLATRRPGPCRSSRRARLPSRPTRTRRRLTRSSSPPPTAVVPLLRGEPVQLGLDHDGGEELPDRPAGVRGLVEAVLLALGVGLGVALFHSRFGFTSAWRQLVASARGGPAGPRRAARHDGHAVRPGHRAVERAARHRARAGRVPVRRGYAARWRVRLRHPVRGRVRPGHDRPRRTWQRRLPIRCRGRGVVACSSLGWRVSR